MLDGYLDLNQVFTPKRTDIILILFISKQAKQGVGLLQVAAHESEILYKKNSYFSFSSFESVMKQRISETQAIINARAASDIPRTTTHLLTVTVPKMIMTKWIQS